MTQKTAWQPLKRSIECTNKQPTWRLFLLPEAAGDVFLQLSQRGGLKSFKVNLDLIRVGVLQRRLTRLDYVHDAAQFVARQLVDVQAQLALLLIRHWLAPVSRHGTEHIWGGEHNSRLQQVTLSNKKSCSTYLSYTYPCHPLLQERPRGREGLARAEGAQLGGYF